MIRRDTIRNLVGTTEPLSSVTAWPTRLGRRILETASVYERELWFVVVGGMLVDVTLTVHGLQLGLQELNPVARAALATLGVPALYGLKAIALAMGVVCAYLIPDRYTVLVPLGLAIPTLFAVVVNTTLISLVML